VLDNGKPDRRHVERKTETEVISAVRELERQRANGKVRRPGQAWTVEQWLTHWVENIAAPAIRPNTLTGYRVAVYNHLIPGIGAHRIDRLQPEHLERLYVNLSKKRTRKSTEFKPARIHQIHRTVRTALGEAVRRGHLVSNPAEIARPPRIPEEEITPFTMKETQQLLNAALTVRNGIRFIIALTLGLRKGEALGLKWPDIDFEQRRMTIRRTVQRLTWQHGCPSDKPCGHKYGGYCPLRQGGGVVAAEVKSGAGKRTIGLPVQLVTLLQEHRSHQKQEQDRACNLWQDEGWVFANRLGGPVHPRVDHDAWKNLLKKAGVRDARLHDARHTAATMLLLLGVPDRAAMDVMGWAQVSMTKRYQHITTELTTMIADQVGNLYWSAGEE
jgi:integrase